MSALLIIKNFSIEFEQLQDGGSASFSHPPEEFQFNILADGFVRQLFFSALIFHRQ